MRFPLLSVALALALGGFTASAQSSCSSLTVTGSGQPGTTLTFALDGAAANAPAILLLATQTGSFTISLGPLGSVTLGVTPPFVPVQMGNTDANGDASVAILVPNVSQLPKTTLYVQASTVSLQLGRPPQIAFCESNVQSFSVGT